MPFLILFICFIQLNQNSFNNLLIILDPSRFKEDRNRSVPLVKILKPHEEFKSFPSIDSTSSNEKSTFSKISIKEKKNASEAYQFVDLKDKRFDPSFWKLTKN